MKEAERKKLNLKAGRLILGLGIPIVVHENGFDVLREKRNFVGYASYYVKGCYDESELRNKAEIEIFKQLCQIDSKLGTTQTEQLFGCVLYSVRIDLIKVRLPPLESFLIFKFNLF